MIDHLPTLMALIDIFTTGRTDTRICCHCSTAPRTLQSLAGGLNVLVKISVLHHKIACYYRQGKLDLNLSLSRLQRHFLGLVPQSRFVLQLHNCMHVSVVVVYVDSPHHLRAFQFSNSHRNLTDRMATEKLHDLCCCGEFRVHFYGAEFDGRIRHFWVVTHQTGIRLEIIALQFNELAHVGV